MDASAAEALGDGRIARACGVAREHLPGLVALFEAASCHCYCQWWQFAGDDNAWQLRWGEEPLANRVALAGDFDSGAFGGERPGGVVALDAERVVGWLRQSPSAAVPKMFTRRGYRDLPWFRQERTGVHIIGCVLVHPESRRRGVARVLIEGAIAQARREGARALEALPRNSSEPLGDEALWLGPMKLYAELGFGEVAGIAGYPVMRIDL